jgi:hypothetical protein
MVEASSSNSVRKLVQRLEQGGPSTDATAPPAAPSAASFEPSPPIDHQVEHHEVWAEEPGIYVHVLSGRGFPAYAEVGSYVCLSVLGDSDDIAQLTIGLFSRLFLPFESSSLAPIFRAPSCLLPRCSVPSAHQY